METNDKYKELYVLSNKLLDDESARFHRTDEKAAKYLSVITLLIGIQAACSKHIIEIFIPPTTLLEWILLNLAILTTIALVVTWFVIFQTFRMHNLTARPMNQETIDFFDDNEEIDIYYTLAKANSAALQKNQNVTDRKCKALYHGYRMLIATVTIFLAFMVLFFVYSWQQQSIRKAAAMQESQKTSSVTPQVKEAVQEQTVTKVQEPARREATKPNKDLKAPEYISLANEKTVEGK
ncbi:MAG: hypothetical protein ACK4UN_02300 [Limisphaerales bacterium]